MRGQDGETERQTRLTTACWYSLTATSLSSSLSSHVVLGYRALGCEGHLAQSFNVSTSNFASNAESTFEIHWGEGAFTDLNGFRDVVVEEREGPKLTIVARKKSTPSRTRARVLELLRFVLLRPACWVGRGSDAFSDIFTNSYNLRAKSVEALFQSMNKEVRRRRTDRDKRCISLSTVSYGLLYAGLGNSDMADYTIEHGDFHPG